MSSRLVTFWCGRTSIPFVLKLPRQLFISQLRVRWAVVWRSSCGLPRKWRARNLLLVFPLLCKKIVEAAHGFTRRLEVILLVPLRRAAHGEKVQRGWVHALALLRCTGKFKLLGTTSSASSAVPAEDIPAPGKFRTRMPSLKESSCALAMNGPEHSYAM